MRAFIGVEFTEETKQNLMEMQKAIRNSSLRGRWKYISNFHLTLKFLGEVSETTAFSIYEKMKVHLKDFESFDIKFDSAGYFSGTDSLRVVYLGLHSPDNRLESLFNMVEDSCCECGILREDRKYTPHITLAQDVVLQGNFKDLKAKLDIIHKPVIKVQKVSIIKSEQVDGKRIYTNFLSVPLNMHH